MPESPVEIPSNFISKFSNFMVAVAGGYMIIDHAYSLHERPPIQKI